MIRVLVLVITLVCLFGCDLDLYNMDANVPVSNNPISVMKTAKHWQYVCFDSRVYVGAAFASNNAIMTVFLDDEGKPYTCEAFCNTFPDKCKRR